MAILLLAISWLLGQPLLAGQATDYVGSETCRACHQAEYSAWQGSHHDLAMQLPTAGDGFLSVDDADGEVAWGLEALYAATGGTSTSRQVDELVAFLEALTDPCVTDRACLGPWIADPELDDVDGRRGIRGDPTEGALVVAAAKLGMDKHELEARYPRTEELPFSSERKRMTTFHPDPRYGDFVAYMKGAPDVVLGLCDQVLEDGMMRRLTEERRSNVLEQNEALAANALRVLGVAFRTLKSVPENPVHAPWKSGASHW